MSPKRPTKMAKMADKAEMTNWDKKAELHKKAKTARKDKLTRLA